MASSRESLTVTEVFVFDLTPTAMQIFAAVDVAHDRCTRCEAGCATLKWSPIVAVYQLGLEDDDDPDQPLDLGGIDIAWARLCISCRLKAERAGLVRPCWPLEFEWGG